MMPSFALGGQQLQKQQQQLQDDNDICTSELNLFYLCYHVLGTVQMSVLTSSQSIFDCTIDAAVDQFLFAENCEIVLESNANNRMNDALLTLVQLSNFPQLQERMYGKVEMLLFKQLSATTTKNIHRLNKQRFAEILRNLSRCHMNKLMIYQGKLLPILLGLLQHGHYQKEDTDLLQITRFVLGTLNNIATLDENAVGLIQKPQFLETVVDYCEHGGTNTIKERAIWTLQSLACADENEIPMYEMPHLISTLINCVRNGATKEIQAYAIETLRNLANQNQPKMYGNQELFFTLLDVIKFKPCQNLKTLAFSCFQRMGCSNKQVHAFILLETFCEAREVKRTSPNFIQYLPTELIRKLSEHLYGRIRTGN
jgi:hypothetical protein